MADVSKLKLALGVELRGYYRDLRPGGSADQTFADRIAAGLTTGQAAGEADLMFAGRRTLAGGASEGLGLSGALADAFSAALTFGELAAMLLRADAANVGDLLVGGGANPVTSLLPAGATLRLRPGGLTLIAAPQSGYAVATGADVLQVANQAGAAVAAYEIILIGRSTAAAPPPPAAGGGMADGSDPDQSGVMAAAVL